MTIESSYADTPLEPQLPILPMTRDRRIARWISRLTSPPLVAIGGAIFTASEISGRGSWYWALFIVCFNILLPSGYILWLKRRGKVTDFDVYLREQRFWPYIFSISCGAISWLAMAYFQAPRLMTIISGATVGQGLVMFLINQRWKISAHSAGVAGVTVLIWQLLGSAATPILLVIPLVGWSRVRLGRHTLGQVIMGAVLGACIFLSSLAIWY
jgi:membrane-associated phospholipid phosphatase